ncbi:MAG: deoxyhypusine synthase [Myxococcota bacterium]
MTPDKAALLSRPVAQLDLKDHDVRSLVDAMGGMSFQARNLHRAATIYDEMLRDPDCAVILCLAGSLFSAGLRQVVIDLVRHQMVDAIVSTGALIVDQDFFEALGFRHWHGTPLADDATLRELGVDRIYDTYIDEDDLKRCDLTVREIADALPPGAYSSREFIAEMGRWLVRSGLPGDSVIRAALEEEVPVFCPAFADSSAGFGLVVHQYDRGASPVVAIDGAKDFLELTRLKMAVNDTGLFIVGGGVPKNFAQDVVVATEMVGRPTPMHKYDIQLTVADERDGGLSGSTLREAGSWGKVAASHEQMVFGEATVTMPLVAGYAWHRRGWDGRRPRRLASVCGR